MFILACMALIFHPDEELDLYRYYENANMLSVDTSIWDYIKLQFLREGDFFYGVSFLLVKKIGLPISVVNFFYVGLYYWMIYKILSYYSTIRESDYKFSWLFVYVAVFTFWAVQPILVFSISRQVSAIAIFYIGILYYLKGKPKVCFLFIVFSMFFHVGMFMFIILVMLGYYVYKLRLYNLFARRTFVWLIVVGLIISAINLSTVMNIINNFSFIFSERYQNTYLGMEQDDSSMGLSLDMMLQILLLLMNLSILKNNNLLFSVGIVLYFALCFFATNMFFLVQRTFLFLPVFQGMMTLNYFRVSQKNETVNIYLLLTFATISFSAMSIYFYRRCFL